MRVVRGMMLLAAGGLLTAPAYGTVLAEYGYDAQGRLVRSCLAPATGAYRTQYALDGAGNRTNVTTFSTQQTLQPGQTIVSSDGRFTFAMQGDGNLVLYGPSGAMWDSGTYGQNGAYLAFQGDGNLVVYKADGSTPLWSSQTYAPCAALSVQSDGNVVIYSAAGPAVWSTKTGGH